MITLQRLKELLYYNPALGIFVWKLTRRRCKEGAIAGANDKGYIYIGVGGSHYYGHRLAWFYMTGEWPTVLMDHRNGVKHDNRWCNLREADYAENMHNQNKTKSNKSGVKGVWWDTHYSCWMSQISFRHKRYHVGYFTEIEEAEKAIKKKREELHTAFTNHGEVDDTAT